MDILLMAQTHVFFVLQRNTVEEESKLETESLDIFVIKMQLVQFQRQIQLTDSVQ